MRAQINVFVVAPAMLFWGFERLLNGAASDVRVVGHAPHIDQAASELERVDADVVVVDYDEVLRAETLRVANIDLPILLLAPRAENDNLGHWMRAGVLAVLPKDAAADLLLLAIRTACDAARADSGAARESERSEHRSFCDARLESLTTRERQLVFALVSNSTTPAKVLASKLCISEHTLRNHLTSVYGKLGVHNRLSLHEFALRHRLGDDSGSFQA